MKLQLWQIKILIAITVIMSAMFWHKYEVKVAVNAAVVAQKKEYDNRVQQLELKSLEVQNNLNSEVAKIKDKNNAQIKDINRKYLIAIDSLRQRKERSTASNITGSTCNTESTQGATGEGLLGGHAEISLGIARDAEKLKEYLLQCYSQYDAVREQLNNYRK